MNPTRNTSLLTVVAAGGLSLTTGHAALTTGMAYSAFNLPNPDALSSWATTEPAGAIPFTSTAWNTVTRAHGGYVSDGGNDNIQVGDPLAGDPATWNRVGAGATQTDSASYVALLYRGYMYDSDGIFAFAENIDDNVSVAVNGTVVLMNNQFTQDGAWQNPTRSNSDLTANGGGALGNSAWASLTPAQQAGNFGIGWHLIEIRLGEFAGTGGPFGPANVQGGSNWTGNFGFGIAGIGNAPLPGAGSEYDALAYSEYNVANFPNAPDGGPGLRYDNFDPTGRTNIIIPEPSGLALLAAGLSLGALARRRRV